MIVDILLEGEDVVIYEADSGKLSKFVPKVYHRPYFYVKYTARNLEKARKLLEENKIVDYQEADLYHFIYRKKVKLLKIVTEKPYQVKKLRELFPDREVYEADIQYVVRFSIDTNYYPGLPAGYKDPMNFQKTLLEPIEDLSEDVVAFDIEVLNKSPVAFPIAYESLEKLREHVNKSKPSEVLQYLKKHPEIADSPVLSVSLSYYRDGELRVELHMLKKYQATPNLKEYLTAKVRKAKLASSEYECRDGKYTVDTGSEKVEVEVYCYEDELELLNNVWEVLKSKRVWITYNGNAFDVPYLFYRSLRLGLVPPNLRVVTTAVVATNNKEVPVIYPSDGVHADLYLWFTKPVVKNYVHGNAYNNFGLDDVAKAVIGARKYQLKPGTLPSSLKPDELIQYSAIDSYLALRLFEHDYPMMVLLMRATGVPFTVLMTSQISRWIYYLLLRYHHKLGAVFPNRYELDYAPVKTKSDSKTGKGYLGAYVHEPPVGVYFNVVDLDVASLYPTMFIVYNISYETVDNPVVLRNCKKVVEVRHPETGQLLHRICQDERGVVPSLVEKLRDIRLYFKRNGHKPASNALKVLINATYGVFGTQTFPLYSGIAECVTILGQKTTRTLIGYSQNEVGVPVLYADTDSLFLWSPTEEQTKKVIEKGRELGVELEYDKTFRFVVFSGRKKNYLGVTQEGEPIIKGMLAIKSNTPEYFRQLFNETVQELGKCQDPDCVVKVAEKARELVANFKAEETDPEKLALAVSLNKDLYEYKSETPQVKVAKQLQKYGIRVEKGAKVQYIYASGGKPVPLINYYLYGRISLDGKKYRDMLYSVFQQFLDAFGFSPHKSAQLTQFLVKSRRVSENGTKQKAVAKQQTRNLTAFLGKRTLNNSAKQPTGKPNMLIAIGSKVLYWKKHLAVLNEDFNELYILKAEGEKRSRPPVKVLENVVSVGKTNKGILAVRKEGDYNYVVENAVSGKVLAELPLNLGYPVHVDGKKVYFVNPRAGKVYIAVPDNSEETGWKILFVKPPNDSIVGFQPFSRVILEGRKSYYLLAGEKLRPIKGSKVVGSERFLFVGKGDRTVILDMESLEVLGAVPGSLVTADSAGTVLFTTAGTYVWDGESGFTKEADFVPDGVVAGVRKVYVVREDRKSGNLEVEVISDMLAGRKSTPKVIRGGRVAYVSPDRAVVVVENSSGAYVIFY